MNKLSASRETQPKTRIVVRDATENDMASVQQIYAYYVVNGLATFEEEPPMIDEIASRRMDVLRYGLPYLVAELDSKVLGYCYATLYRTRSAYRYTVEDSVYIAPGRVRQGLGRALLSTLITRCETGPWRQMVAVIGDTANVSSVALHQNLGFRTVGTLRAVGFKFGRWVDTVVMQRELSEGSDSLPMNRDPR